MLNGNGQPIAVDAVGHRLEACAIGLDRVDRQRASPWCNRDRGNADRRKVAALPPALVHGQREDRPRQLPMPVALSGVMSAS